MQEPTLFIGVDVSKAELVISMGAERRPRGVANDAHSIAHWLRELPPHALIAMESTGRYHGLLAQMASQAGLKVYVLNARDVYYYARALGTRAKTDGVDSGVIARYLAEHHKHLHPWQQPSPAQQELQALLLRRAQVVVHRTALRQILKDVPLDATPLQAGFEIVLKNIDDRIEKLIASDARLAQGCRRLRTITGIGAQTAPLVAYAGLDPRPNDSGAKRGKRYLSKKGPPLLRRQMYMAGFAASHSKALKALYQALRAKGFATTQAFIILGRKLLRVAFAVWKGTESFDPTRLGAHIDLKKT
jgi:transposase